MAWSVALFYVIQPEKVEASAILKLVLPSAVLTLLFIWAGQLHFMEPLLQAKTDFSIFKRFGAFLFTGLIQQLIILAPFFVVYAKMKRSDTTATITFYGLVAGMVTNLMPFLMMLIVLNRSRYSDYLMSGFDTIQIFALLVFPVVAGIIGAITGSFVVAALRDEKAFWGWMSAAMVLPVVLSTLFLASASVIVGIVVVVLSILTLATRLNPAK